MNMMNMHQYMIKKKLTSTSDSNIYSKLDIIEYYINLIYDIE